MFIGEFGHLNIHEDNVKYNILVEKWPTHDVSNYSKLIDREQKNYNKIRDFCDNSNDILPEILDKTPQYDVSTPFWVFLADMTK